MCTNEPAFDMNAFITGTLGGFWSGNGINGSNFDAATAGEGNHDVTYLVDGFACSESFTQTINVYLEPIIDAGLDEAICDLAYQLDAISNLPNLGYWMIQTGATFLPDSTSENAQVVVDTYGAHSFYYFVDQNGICSAIDSVEIMFDQQPIADAGPDQDLDFLFETTLAANTPSVGTGEWSVVSGAGFFYSMDDPLTMVEELQVGDNEFMWTVTNGSCPEATDAVVVSINDLWVPEVITPNGDELNDFFVVKGIENSENVVQIFNRWGQLVFEQSNYQNDWDGYSSSGVLLEDETYFYIIKVNDERVFNGYVVLKR